MDKPIQVGDLVMVVRPGVPCPRGCDKAPQSLGLVFQVAIIEETGLLCLGCGAHKGRDITAADQANQVAYRLSILKRIPPMSQLEHYRSEELLRRDVKERA